jgi:hypothetical protein
MLNIALSSWKICSESINAEDAWCGELRHRVLSAKQGGYFTSPSLPNSCSGKKWGPGTGSAAVGLVNIRR